MIACRSFVTAVAAISVADKAAPPFKVLAVFAINPVPAAPVAVVTAPVEYVVVRYLPVSTWKTSNAAAATLVTVIAVQLYGEQEIIIMMGYPGSGKSSIAENICKNEKNFEK